jgi:hypothetical protein
VNDDGTEASVDDDDDEDGSDLSLFLNTFDLPKDSYSHKEEPETKTAQKSNAYYSPRLFF